MTFQKKFLGALLTIAVVSVTTHSAEISQNLAPEVQKTDVPTSNLAIEAQRDSEGLDLNDIETKSRNSALAATIKSKSDKQPIILGATSKVAIVYSEKKANSFEKEKPTKAPRVVYSQKEGISASSPSTNSKQNSADRNWRGVKVSPRDSYLDAFQHSQTSKDPREAVISADVEPKIPKLIRRDYTEGPVYRHPNEQYAKETGPSYSPHGTSNRLTSTSNARISYGGPTPETFYPTPSNSYSLPVQSVSAQFNDKDRHSVYGVPQTTYGSPTPQVQIYDAPSYNRPSVPQSSYGLPNSGYPVSGTPQQAYGAPPAQTYGAPYAIQQLPSLMPSIDLSWPFALKLNAFTLAKILLKLVIFKMIVKFIALICLLLFIPKLEIKKGDNDDSDDSRKFFSRSSKFEPLDTLTEFVTSSIEEYKKEISGKSTDDCSSLGCRLRKSLTYGETWQDYLRLFKSYVSEETKHDDNSQRVQTNHLDSKEN